MPLSILILLVFIASTASIVGVFLALSRRSQSAREKSLEQRLSEAAGGVAPPEPGEAGDTPRRIDGAPAKHRSCGASGVERVRRSSSGSSRQAPTSA